MKALWNAPRDNPLNLIRLGPAEGWLVNSARNFSPISKALRPGEKIVWQGTPSPWIAARRSLLFMTIAKLARVEAPIYQTLIMPKREGVPL